MSDHFDVVDYKIREAHGHLDRMAKVLIHPRHRPDLSRYQAAFLSTPNTIIHHEWHEPFKAALHAFLSATRSIPDIIDYRFGYDRRKKNKWLLRLDADEQARRRDFSNRFKVDFDQFRLLPLNAERNNSHHVSGMARWKVIAKGSWGTYEGGPLQPLPRMETRPSIPGEDSPPGWMEGAYVREITFTCQDFWWVIPQNGASELKLPLFGECRRFLGEAEKLAIRGRQLFDEIHKGQRFTLPPW